MSDETTAAQDAQDPRVVVLQAVVDRVTSWQDGATPETVRAELDRELGEAGVDLDDDQRDRVVEHVVAGGSHDDLADILG